MEIQLLADRHAQAAAPRHAPRARGPTVEHGHSREAGHATRSERAAFEELTVVVDVEQLRLVFELTAPDVAGDHEAAIRQRRHCASAAVLGTEPPRPGDVAVVRETEQMGKLFVT